MIILQASPAWVLLKSNTFDASMCCVAGNNNYATEVSHIALCAAQGLVVDNAIVQQLHDDVLQGRCSQQGSVPDDVPKDNHVVRHGHHGLLRAAQHHVCRPQKNCADAFMPAAFYNNYFATLSAGRQHLQAAAMQFDRACRACPAMCIQAVNVQNDGSIKGDVSINANTSGCGSAPGTSVGANTGTSAGC
jgi:hypothetical protein